MLSGRPVLRLPQCQPPQTLVRLPLQHQDLNRTELSRKKVNNIMLLRHLDGKAKRLTAGVQKGRPQGNCTQGSHLVIGPLKGRLQKQVLNKDTNLVEIPVTTPMSSVGLILRWTLT